MEISFAKHVKEDLKKLARNLNEEATRNTKPNTTKITMMLMLNGEIELFFRSSLTCFAKLISIIYGFSHHTEYHSSFIIIRIITIVVVVCVFLWLPPLTVISAGDSVPPICVFLLRTLSYLHNISSSSSSSSSSLHCFGSCRISFPFLD